MTAVISPHVRCRIPRRTLVPVVALQALKPFPAASYCLVADAAADQNRPTEASGQSASIVVRRLRDGAPSRDRVRCEAQLARVERFDTENEPHQLVNIQQTQPSLCRV